MQTLTSSSIVNNGRFALERGIGLRNSFTVEQYLLCYLHKGVKVLRAVPFGMS